MKRTKSTKFTIYITSIFRQFEQIEDEFYTEEEEI